MHRLVSRSWPLLLVAALSGVPVAAAPPVDAAAVRALIAKLDLRQLAGPDGTNVGQFNATEVRMVVPTSIKKTYESLSKQLKDLGWKPVEDESLQVTDKYAQVTMTNEDCLLSMSLSPDAQGDGGTAVDIRNHGPFDTRKLPHPADAKKLYESQFTSTYVVSGKVHEVADQVRKELVAQGWQEFGRDDTVVGPQDEHAMLDFRSGPVLVGVFIGVAPAQGGKTSIQYSTNLCVNELPWPADVAKADFSDYGPTLHTVSKESLEDLVRWYGKELKAIGWEMNAGWVNVNENNASIAFSQFTVPQRNLLLMLTKVEAGTQIAIEPVSNDALIKMAKDAVGPGEMPGDTKLPTEDHVDEPEPKLKPLEGLTVYDLPLPKGAEGVHYDAEASDITFGCPMSVKEIVKFYRDELVGDGWKEDRRFAVITDQAGSFTIAGPGEAELSFTLFNNGLGDGTAVTINVTNMSFARRPIEPIAAEEMPTELQPGENEPPLPGKEKNNSIFEPEDNDGFPVPIGYNHLGNERTPFRRLMTSSHPAPLDDIVSFYRQHLPMKDWQEDTKQSKVEKDKAHLVFTGKEDPLHVNLTRQGEETHIEILQRSSAKAKKEGLLPQPGKARVVFGNAGDTDVKVVFGGSPFTIKAGVGAKKPDGPGFDVVPGRYTVKVEIPGQEPHVEKFEVKADETWGVIVEPELGVLPLQVY